MVGRLGTDLRPQVAALENHRFAGPPRGGAFLTDIQEEGVRVGFDPAAVREGKDGNRFPGARLDTLSGADRVSGSSGNPAAGSDERHFALGALDE